MARQNIVAAFQPRQSRVGVLRTIARFRDRALLLRADLPLAARAETIHQQGHESSVAEMFGPKGVARRGQAILSEEPAAAMKQNDGGKPPLPFGPVQDPGKFNPRSGHMHDLPPGADRQGGRQEPAEDRPFHVERQRTSVGRRSMQ